MYPAGGVKKVLDMCCASRMFWFDKKDPLAVYGDLRVQKHEILCDGRGLEIKPEVQFDFRSLPFRKAAFRLVVFDPPHLVRAGPRSYMANKYGKLFDTWRDDLRRGFSEGFRVLAPDGILIFKWNETNIKLSEILHLADRSPLFGHRSGRREKTHWVCFMNTEPSS